MGTPLNHYEPTRPQIVTVGTLKSAKGHDTLICAFRIVAGKHPKAELTIVGGGLRRNKYQALINQLGLSEKVQITGWKKLKEVRSILNKASLFVFPSRSASFGIALVEAMAMGLPIVASTAGGIPEVVGEAEVKLVPPNSPGGLSRAIHTALEDKLWRNVSGRFAQARAGVFSWEYVLDAYERLLLGDSRSGNRME